jgi:type IV pilus assembly protein PilQ
MNKRRLWLRLSLITLMGQGSHALSQDNFPEKTITLKFSSVDLRQLLQMLAEMRGLNLMMSDKVSGKTSINMKNASWQTTFESVLASKSLGSRFDKDVLWWPLMRSWPCFIKDKKIVSSSIKPVKWGNCVKS